MGPDLNGHYGGLNGVGGLEATIRESDGTVTPVLNDFFGNVLATISGTTASWNSVRVGGYGPVLGYQAATLNAGTPLAESLLWRSRRIDPSGFYNLGARYYDPMAGRFLSPDPMGHAGSMDLYSAFNGDPINHFDPDGRFSAGSLNGAERYGSQTYANLGNALDAVLGSIVGIFNPGYAARNFGGGYQADASYQNNYDRGSDAYRAGSDFGYVAAGIGLQVGLIAATEGLAELAPALEGAEGLEEAGAGLEEANAVRGTGNFFNEAGQGEFGFVGELESAPAAELPNTFTASGQGEFGFVGELESAPVQNVAQPFTSQAVSGASQAQQLELNFNAPSINAQRIYHQNYVNDIGAQLQSQGGTVYPGGARFYDQAGGGYSIADILVRRQDGSYAIYEIKTGAAETTAKQNLVYPQIMNGDAIPTAKVADFLGIKPGDAIKEVFPNGIPVYIIRALGL